MSEKLILPSSPVTHNLAVAAPALDPSQNRISVTLPNGLSVAEILHVTLPDHAVIPLDRIRIALVTPAGSMIIEHERWHNVRPKPGVSVVIRIVPGKGALRSILQVFVSIAAVALGQFWGPLIAGSAFGLGLSAAAWTGIVGLGVSLIGNLLINALVPMPGNDQSKPKPVFMISSWRNQMTPDGIVPAVLGKHRIAPPLGATGFTEIVGDLQYARFLGCFGHGPLLIEDIRIGDTPISKFEEVQYEVRQGFPNEEPLSIYPTQVIEEQFGIELRRDKPRDEQGEIMEDKPAEETPVERFSAGDAEELAVMIGFPAGLIRINDEGKQKTLDVKIRIRHRLLGASAWENVTTLNIRAKKREAFYRVHRWKPAQRGRYEVQVTRMTDERTSAQETDRAVLVCLQSYRPEYPVNIAKPMALIALRIKATYQLNNALDNVNAVVTRICPDWDRATQAWITRPTRNPASLFRWVLQGGPSTFPAADSEIDLEELQDWHEFCTDKNLKYDRIHDFEASLADTLAVVASAGRASPRHDGRKWGVVIDRPRQFVVDQINSRNSRSFSWQRNYINPPHAFRVTFLDETNNYQSSERLVPWPGYVGDITVTEKIELPGKTDPAEIWRETRRRQYEIIHRPDRFTAIQDGSARVATRGDMVMGAWDVLQSVQRAARVFAVRGNHVEIDEDVTMEAGQSYGIRFRHFMSDQDSVGFDVVRKLAPFSGTTRGLVLDGSGIRPAHNAIIHFGLAGKESEPLIVAGTEAANDMATSLTMLPAAPIIDALTDAEVPPFWDGRVGTDLGGGLAKPTQPQWRAILSGVSGTDNANRIEVLLQPGSGSVAVVGTYIVFHRLQGTTAWIISEGSVADGGVIISAYVKGQIVEMQAQALSVSDVASDRTETVTVEVGGNDLAIPSSLPTSGILIIGGYGFASITFVTGDDAMTTRVQVYRNTNGTLNRDTDKVGIPLLVEPRSSYARIDGDATRSSLISNGDFGADAQWTKGIGWSIEGGKATHASGTASGLRQAISGLIAGATYRYRFVVSDRSTGTVNIQLDGGGTTSAAPTVSQNNAQSGKIVGNAGNTSVTLWASGTFNGSVDDVALFEETAACLPQGTVYYWLEPQNDEGVAGPVAGPFPILIT